VDWSQEWRLIEMSIAQLKRRTDALHRTLGGTRKRSFTLEELHRALWHQDKRAYRKLVGEGCRSAQFFQQEFEREDDNSQRQPAQKTPAYGRCQRRRVAKG
jgi:hypothetical protein